MARELIMALLVDHRVSYRFRGVPLSEPLRPETAIDWYESFCDGNSGATRIHERTSLQEKQNRLLESARFLDGNGRRDFEIRYGLVETSQLKTVYAGGEENKE